MSATRRAALKRAGYCCEAMVLVNNIWTRCGKRDVEVHHALTRARGGHLLDEVNEHYHLIVLCHYHHRNADGSDAYAADLLIEGYVINESGGLVYYGPDPYLRNKYPMKELRHDRT